MPSDPFVMLVEDNRDDEELALHALRRAGVERVEVARDGDQAITRLLSEGPPPGLVFLDLRLPKVDGIEVLRTVRSGERTRALPVVVLSSSEDPKDLSACENLGVVSVIPKPLTVDRVRALLGGRAVDASCRPTQL